TREQSGMEYSCFSLCLPLILSLSLSLSLSFSSFSLSLSGLFSNPPHTCQSFCLSCASLQGIPLTCPIDPQHSRQSFRSEKTHRQTHTHTHTHTHRQAHTHTHTS